MPILYDFDLERKIVYERWEESLTVEDVIFISTQPQKEKRFPPDTRALFVFHYLSSLSISDIEHIRALITKTVNWDLLKTNKKL